MNRVIPSEAEGPLNVIFKVHLGSLDCARMTGVQGGPRRTLRSVISDLPQ
jgi:hypothetical protein